ncbi:MAG: ACP S-malonyltransferase [Planctomycetota bacterium]|jgi:[acyl-carrier-protein] S-malonyltransferase
MTEAFLFPGQGAQQVGMLAGLAEASPAARAVFDAADEQLGFDLSRLCFEGPPDRLDATDVCQPAIFVCSAAMLAAMDEALGERAPAPAMLAGLSLGEYTALYAADAIDFAPALNLVARRGRFMQAAAEARAGGMVSVLGLDEPKVVELCEMAAEGQVLAPANFNSPGQIVISGDVEACERAQALAADCGARGAIRLKVAGAFHSSLMAPAAEELAEAIRTVEFRPPRRPVLANTDAAPHQEPEQIRRALVEQVTSPVRWCESVRYMLDNSIDSFYEIGPGRVLTGLLRRIEPGAPCRCVNSADALAKLAGEAVEQTHPALRRRKDA